MTEACIISGTHHDFLQKKAWLTKVKKPECYRLIRGFSNFWIYLNVWKEPNRPLLTLAVKYWRASGNVTPDVLIYPKAVLKLNNISHSSSVVGLVAKALEISYSNHDSRFFSIYSHNDVSLAELWIQLGFKGWTFSKWYCERLGL